MDSHTFLVLLGGLLLLAFVAETAFDRFKVPPVLVLIACGLLLGPVLRVLPASRFTEVAPHFGALAFLLILFEGGLDLPIAQVLHRLRAGAFLGVVGFAAAALMTAAAGAAWGLPPERAFGLGLVLAPVSGAIVLPLAGRLGLREELRMVVVLEAALADVFAVLGMGVYGQLLTGGGLAGLLALGSLMTALFSVLLGAVTGLVWPGVLRRLGDRRYLDVLTFGVALVLWGVVEAIGASGALVVLVFGLVLANDREILEALGLAAGPTLETAHETVEGLHRFIGQLTFLVRTFFFVFLGVVVNFAHLPWRWYLFALVLTGVWVFVRHLVLDYVASSTGTGLAGGEHTGLSLLQPRGLVSAVLAIEAAHLGVDDGGLFVGVASLVILFTNGLLMVAARLVGEAPSPGTGNR